ncbi:DUF4126 domain-containing protein [Ruania zhangjianzhongii]|uniref:DUF4126 domain-containing protein n=1 Tax=Ruania zhangjianzhongii TaxID=2603206 RepID=UPI0011CB52C3|nr:DUF4126 domain-containing protein [Ruania zhangjianzhongii]
MELLTGSGLAISAGLNAYVPLLLVGLLGRFTDLVALPSQWAWLGTDVALIVLGVLLLVEVVADKVPSIDHVNDLLQTVVRPTAGGIVFAAGSSAGEAAITATDQIVNADTVLPVVAGVLLSLVTHLAKAGLRAGVNLSTAGVGAPVASTVEDVFSVSLSLVALLLPLLVLVAVVGAVAMLVGVRKRRRRRDRLRT